MPSAAARRLYEDQIPPFMTVFDLDAETMADQDTVTVVNPKFMEMASTCAPSMGNPLPSQPLRSVAMPPDPMHKHHDSTSTQASESAESSPTTTLSTTDSSPLSDPSPSSSPDSPTNLIPLSSFPATSFGGLAPLNTLTTLTIPEHSSSTAETGRPMTSPAPRRPKNMKGLSIQPPCLNMSAVTSTMTLNNSITSEPTSPSFIKPTIPAMKRKPSQLSLKTNSSDLMAMTTLEVPSTPSLPPILQRRALKHSTSSPHMLSGLKSATAAPVGGMCFPKVLERNESGLSELLRPTKTGMASTFEVPINEEDSPIRTQMANRAAIDAEPFHEQEQNEDQKTPGYPDGPIAIYDDNVYLYLEPTAEEASKFDVVINVAREVLNPFNAVTKPSEKKTESPIPDTAATNATYATAFEVQPNGNGLIETPTTPKATFFPSKQPEYIHMPWDHNTDIAPDLMGLCETIESRTREGKKVLVHCQQGASRSASLIIAYGFYRDSDLSVNDAYYAAQAKSKWISPNMRLMYCLQDFQKQVSRRKASPGSAYRPRTGRSPTKHRLTLSADAIELPHKEPRTAPLPDEGADGGEGNNSPSKGSASRCRGFSSPDGQAISPGPSSAPSSFTWSEAGEKTELKPVPEVTSSAQVDVDRLMPRIELPSPDVESRSDDFSMKPPPSPGFSPQGFGSPAGFGFATLNLGPAPSERKSLTPELEPLPVPAVPVDREVAVVGAFPDDAALMSPRAETMTNNPLHWPCNDVAGMHFIEDSPGPSEDLFSPRQTMFPRDPFLPFGRPPQNADPRSPPTKGETPIVRSIDEIL